MTSYNILKLVKRVFDQTATIYTDPCCGPLFDINMVISGGLINTTTVDSSTSTVVCGPITQYRYRILIDQGGLNATFLFPANFNGQNSLFPGITITGPGRFVINRAAFFAGIEPIAQGLSMEISVEIFDSCNRSFGGLNYTDFGVTPAALPG